MAVPGRAALMDAYLGAWNAHDSSRVASFFAPTAVYDDRGAAEEARGRDGIQAHVERVLTAFPDLRFEVVRAVHSEAFSAAEWRASMTHGGDLFGLAATGRRLESAGVDVATVGDDDRVSHLVSYYDGAALMRQLGLLPAHGSRTESAVLRLASLLPR